MNVRITTFDLAARLDAARALARTAMSAAGQPGGILIGQYFHEVTELDGLLALGAFHDDELVGMLLGWPTASRDWWPAQVRPDLAQTGNLHWLDDAFELAEIHVHPDHQGRGLGGRLLGAAEERIPQRRIVLGTNAIDNHRAKEFYRRRGFRTLTGPFRWLGLPLRVLVLGREIAR
ncbi:GNAT family N-acetyltransferase [Saccharopolyspora sp. CA-218241]|uniref:GNAT family N-acetyltransferase n=1 Tax=Saccharopolyspora sp. CA-218241 TaxID=3240027 RepID=UPI003D99DB29